MSRTQRKYDHEYKVRLSNLPEKSAVLKATKELGIQKEPSIHG